MPTRRSQRADRSGAALLLAGAVLVVVLFEGLTLRFFWVPAVVGAVFVVAAGASRSRGQFWGPGLVLLAAGLASGLWFQSGRPADLEYAALDVVALGTGAVLVALLERAGLQVGAMGVALPTLLFGAYSLAEQQQTQHVAGNGWLVAGFLGGWGLLELATGHR